MRIGIVVAWLHDIADIFVTLCKTFDCTTYEMGTYVSFAGTVISWFITRLVWFPTLIFGIMMNCRDVLGENVILNQILVYSFVTFLLTLQVLHVYWFYLFILIFKKALEGDGHDI